MGVYRKPISIATWVHAYISIFLFTASALQDHLNTCTILCMIRLEKSKRIEKKTKLDKKEFLGINCFDVLIRYCIKGHLTLCVHQLLVQFLQSEFWLHYTCILDQWTLSNTINNTNNRNHFCQGFFSSSKHPIYVHAVSARSTV